MNNRKILITIIIIMFFISAVAYMQYTGLFWHTGIFASCFKIKGLDVSHHQGGIDWEKVPKDKYKFVFIKASEGMNHADRKFRYNWDNALKNGFAVGAYHFFTTSSTGEQQAENFIGIVPVHENSLPPVIDIEIDIQKDADELRKELLDMINALKTRYKKTPILYVTHGTYNAFILGHFDECPIWIRNIIMFPFLRDGREWKFWQHSNRGRVPGINDFVDINVFHSDMAELKKYLSASL